jgi:hypothetical protein
MILCALAAAFFVTNGALRADTVYIGTPRVGGIDDQGHSEGDGNPYHVTINLTNNNNSTATDKNLAAGNIENSTLTSAFTHGLTVNLPLYCVDIPDAIGSRSAVSYSADVNTAGIIYNDQKYFGQTVGLSGPALANAAQIDYLMNKYGATGTEVGGPNATELKIQSELQIAMWRLVYNDGTHIDLNASTSGNLTDGTSGTHNDYGTNPGDGTPGVQGMLNDAAGHAHDALLSNVVWINPINQDGTYQQGLIGLLSPGGGTPPPIGTPVPGSLVLLCTGLASFGGIGWLNKRRKMKAAA